ncbi:MAG: hypothetical protein ACQETM_02915 [Bacteroidota bacterium]
MPSNHDHGCDNRDPNGSGTQAGQNITGHNAGRNATENQYGYSTSGNQPGHNERIDRICEAVTAWLDNEDDICKTSVERTVTEGLFPRHDVMHMLGRIEKSVTREALRHWIDRIATGLTHDPAGSEKVLCLHAGNLPMVGLQDVIATLLSGAVYYGKLSSRDPWLLDGLLRVLRKRLPDQLGGWASRMEKLGPIGARHVLFAGSQASVDVAMEWVYQLGLACKDARLLARTARLSMAWLDETDFEHDPVRLSRQLIEAMLRYEGRGCRSLAVVVAAWDLSDVAGTLADAAGVFLRSNPPSHYRMAGVSYWRGYLKSTGRDVYDLGGQIITDDPDLLGKEHVVCWFKGNESDLLRIAGQFGSQLQNVYINADQGDMLPRIPESLADARHIRLEPLSLAQSPPIDWRPDGVDVLGWLWDTGQCS